MKRAFNFIQIATPFSKKNPKTLEPHFTPKNRTLFGRGFSRKFHLSTRTARLPPAACYSLIIDCQEASAEESGAADSRIQEHVETICQTSNSAHSGSFGKEWWNKTTSGSASKIM